VENGPDDDHDPCYEENIHNTLETETGSRTYGNKKRREVQSNIFHTNRVYHNLT